MSIKSKSKRIDDFIIAILKKRFSEEASITMLQFVKSLFAGGIATVADIGILWLLKDILNFYYLIAGAISFSIGLVVNYIITNLWVFEKSSIKDKKVEFAIFTIIALIGLGLNILFMWIFTDLLLFHYLISKCFATIIVYGFNFTARKVIIYK